MATWHFIGIVLGVMIILAYALGRSRSVLGGDGQPIDPDEARRRKDAVAADAARTAEARLPPFQGGINF